MGQSASSCTRRPGSDRVLCSSLLDRSRRSGCMCISSWVHAGDRQGVSLECDPPLKLLQRLPLPKICPTVIISMRSAENSMNVKRLRTGVVEKHPTMVI